MGRPSKCDDRRVVFQQQERIRNRTIQPPPGNILLQLPRREVVHLAKPAHVKQSHVYATRQIVPRHWRVPAVSTQ